MMRGEDRASGGGLGARRLRLHRGGLVPCVRWERVVPEANVKKFYEVRWVWSLFPVIERSWGRIGARPRRLVRVYASPREAIDELAAVVERRREHGYVLTAGSGPLATVLPGEADR